MNKIPRNSKCWCGSGLKYKKCHFLEDSRMLLVEQGATLESIKTGNKSAKYYRKRYLKLTKG